jgi:hypothetical protein
MERETGLKTFPIWLLGDSEPNNWKNIISKPFDDRHPIIHNIWTSIADKIQDKMFRSQKSRIDFKNLFIRNSIGDPINKPIDRILDWNYSVEIQNNIEAYQLLIHQYKPKLLLSFGAFAYEFGRRCLGEQPNHPFKYWGANRLGQEFRNRIVIDDPINLIPLLHASISGGRFIESHEYFCGKEGENYFEYVAEALFQKVQNYKGILII